MQVSSFSLSGCNVTCQRDEPRVETTPPDALQHRALYNFNHSIPSPRLKQEEKSVTSSFILGKASAQVRLHIFQTWSWAVRSTLAMAVLAALLDFVVTVNSLCLRRLWHHRSHAHSYLSILLTPRRLSILSSSGDTGFSLIPYSWCSSLFTPVISPIRREFWLRRN